MNTFSRRIAPSLALSLALATMGVADAASAQSSSAGSTSTSASQRRASYVYLRGTDTLGIETLTIGDSAVSGDLVLRNAPRIIWSHARQGLGLGVLSVKVFAPGAAANSPPAQQGTIRITGDSAYVDFTAGTRTQKQTMAVPRDAVTLVNASVLHAALIGARVARMGETSVSVFLASGGQVIPATVATHGDTVVFTVANAESRILSDADGMPREILLPSQRARVVRAEGNAVLTSTPPLLTYEAPPGAPYTAEQVRIPTGRGYELAGTLTRPVMNRLVGVAVTISGSGPQERDSRLSMLPGYAIFREIADTLARRGIATLRFDDRGIGASGGAESMQDATSADFADDVRSVIAWLRKRPDIDGMRIALVGHSEGGMIAPMIAATDPTIKAIALLAGQAYTGRRVMMFQNREAIDQAPLSSAQRDSIWATVPSRLDTLATTNKWIGFFMTHDPIATAKRVKQPVLILQGETDHQVSPEQADTLVAAFKAGGNRAVTMKRFPATNHLFLNDPSGLFSGYGALEDTRVRREVLGTLADWLAGVMK
jgi:dipeptidyl aminopeptidase/acylaminoacyl peptidase